MADSPFCLSSLLCEEDHESCFNDDQRDQETTLDKPCFIAEDEDEFVQNMFKKEEAFFRFKGSSFSSSLSDVSSSISQSWLQSARLDALEWIYNVCSFFPFFLSSFFFFPSPSISWFSFQFLVVSEKFTLFFSVM